MPLELTTRLLELEARVKALELLHAALSMQIAENTTLTRQVKTMVEENTMLLTALGSAVKFLGLVGAFMKWFAVVGGGLIATWLTFKGK